MKYFDRLSPEERAEVDAAVHDAYIRGDGTIRTHAEADEVFDRFIADAVQGHRSWAQILLDGWRDDGRRAFLKERWKDARLFDLVHKGRRRRRAERRGTQRRNEDGQRFWIQEPVFDWTAQQLERAIAECARRIDEERANIAMYRALVDLLNQTGAPTVRAALEAVDMSLEEYLAERDAA